jgi:hypothetical protein
MDELEQNIGDHAQWARETSARREQEMAEYKRWQKEINEDFSRQKAEMKAALSPGGDEAIIGEPAVVINPWI